MIRINEQVNKDVKIVEDTILHGQINGNVDVYDNATFNLHGQVNKNLELHDGSVVFLHGSVNGDVINNGGYLEVFGMINGTLSTYEGETKIDKDAVVKNLQRL